MQPLHMEAGLQASVEEPSRASLAHGLINAANRTLVAVFEASSRVLEERKSIRKLGAQSGEVRDLV